MLHLKNEKELSSEYSNLYFSECNTDLKSLREILSQSQEQKIDGRVVQVQTVSSEENLFLSEKNFNDVSVII